MKKLKKVGGILLIVWGVVRSVPDSVESAKATARDAHWLYAHFGAPHSVPLSLAILLVGIGLIFAETIEAAVAHWRLGQHSAAVDSPSPVRLPALPHAQIEADKKILHDLMNTVPSNGAIRFLRHNNFAGFSFDERRLDDIDIFLGERDGPDHEFLDPELEDARQKFRESCKTLSCAIGTHTFPTNREYRQSVPSDWEIDNPKAFHDAVEEIHNAAESVCTTYDRLIRLARSKLAV